MTRHDINIMDYEYFPVFFHEVLHEFGWITHWEHTRSEADGIWYIGPPWWTHDPDLWGGEYHRSWAFEHFIGKSLASCRVGLGFLRDLLCDNAMVMEFAQLNSQTIGFSCCRWKRMEPTYIKKVQSCLTFPRCCVVLRQLWASGLGDFHSDAVIRR